MKFQVNECPLCGKVLNFRTSYGVTVYYCPAETKTHYEVETDGKETIQHIYAFPYAVDNFVNSIKSRVYTWNDTRWKFVKEVPRIVPTNQNVLLAHLQSEIPYPTV
jgi:CRISPR/Cas system-associated protein Cas5 (RAMP superfamily)